MEENRKVLECEDSPEGIFSAVYAVWELHYEGEPVSIRVQTEGQNLELFSEYIPVPADSEKAGKVLHTLRTRFSEEFLEFLYYAACAEGEGKADAVYQCIRQALHLERCLRGTQAGSDGLRTARRVMGNLADASVFRALQLSRATGNERHHYLGFLRFVETPQHILLAAFTPKNNITELVMPHFSDRLPQERFLIWDNRRKIAGIHVPGQPYEMLVLNEDQVRLLQSYEESGQETEQLWKIFVEHISISERRNEGLQKNNLPLRFREFMPEFHK